MLFVELRRHSKSPYLILKPILALPLANPKCGMRIQEIVLGMSYWTAAQQIAGY